MAKKARKKYKELDFNPIEEFEDLFDDELDVGALASDFGGDNGDEFGGSDERISARRKIERRADMKKLYSQLDEWEQFGNRVDW